MSGLGDEIASRAAESVRKPPRQHPEGWEPGIEWDGTAGRITAPTDNRLPDWRSLLELWQFDPDEYEVVEPVQVRTWDAAVGNGEVRRMWYHRAGIRRKRAGGPDIAELVKLVKRVKSVPRVIPRDDAQNAYILALNDWQLGKRGTAATIERIVKAIDASAARARALRPASIWLCILGDLGEACDGQYAMQTFEVELDRRDQGIITRRLALYAIDAHRKIAPVRVPVVGGNHGEHRKDGKAFTTFSDNDDVAWIEEVAEVCAVNPAVYGDVRFLIPRHELDLTVQPVPDGPLLGLLHGHQARRGATAQQKTENWWKDQWFGDRPAGDADILLSAHNHHFSIVDNGRPMIQAPTIDSGSPWFASTAGRESKPSMLSFVLTRDGWDDIKLL
jgi:hypothetical protein